MIQPTTPLTILRMQADVFSHQLARVYDGDADGVHDARVATRRIREVLPLVREWHRRRSIDELVSRFKRIGRSLGRVRDADVRIALLTHLEARIPSAAPTIVLVRQEHELRRQGLTRKLIKRLERAEIQRLLWVVTRRPLGELQPWTALAGAWRDQLRRTVIERADAARDAVEHATGVYFPHRVHKARIAIKKLRYAGELGELTGVGTLDGALRDLRKAQDVLGDVHDRQVLLDELTDATADADGNGQADHRRLVIHVLEAECRELHRKYVVRRDRLLEICDGVRRSYVGPALGPRAAAAIGAVAVSSAIYAWRATMKHRIRDERAASPTLIDVRARLAR
jgi:CHAD domain-containing protein